MVQRRLADMATDLETARTMIWRAAEAADRDRANANRLGIIARLYAAEATHDIAEHCIEIHGGAGSMRAQGVERLMRDAVTNMHLHGTQDIHRIKLVNELTGKGDPGTHA
jgi:alkylation response protein AidB-like acyl-CoA dehydrogenase